MISYMIFVKYCDYIIEAVIYTKYGFRPRTSVESNQASIQ